MVDLHTHILPGVDDGARDWVMAGEMCRMALEDGIRHIVCTPHANDMYAYDRTILQQLIQQLKGTAGVSSELEFSLGCDFNFSFQNIQQAQADPANFAIAKTRYMLVELSDFAIPPAIGETLLRFIESGVIPVITHPERNLVMQQRPELALWFAQMGCVIQLTANSLTGSWGQAPKKLGFWLLEHQAAHVIASDAHNTTTRPPILSKARSEVAIRFGDELARALVLDNPGAIVRGEELFYFPPPKVV